RCHRGAKDNALMISRSALDVPAPIVHVVEDDASARNAPARFLRAAGYTVRTYETAHEFLEARPWRAIGCVVLDLQLPGLSGLDLQRTLTELDEPLPVVFLSGQADIQRSVQAMKSGAVDFLTKTADGTRVLHGVGRGSP